MVTLKYFKKYFAMKKNIKLIVLLILVFVANACKKNTELEKDINAYNEYIAVFPEKMVSVTSKLDFFLKKKINATVTNDVITIKPSVKGNVTLDNNVISFVPSEKLESNQEYKITLHLAKLYANIDPALKDFTINVKTKELLFNIALQAPKVYTKDWYFVEGVLTASDVIEKEKLAEIVRLAYKGKKAAIKFQTFENLASKVYFKIDSLQRFVDDENLKVSWSGAAIKSASKGTRELTITGKNNFKVLNVEVANTDKQRIEISFSDPIKKSQDLKGLIQFKNTQKRNFTYNIANNIVTVYPKSSFKNKVNIEIFKGIKNTENYKLKESFSKTLHFQQLKPSVSFIKSGTILPNSKNLKINFNAVNLKAVDVTVFKIYKDNVLQFLQSIT